MPTWEYLSTLLVLQFENEHNRRSLVERDPPSRLKFVEDCLRRVGELERLSTHGWKRIEIPPYGRYSDKKDKNHILDLLRNSGTKMLSVRGDCNDITLCRIVRALRSELKTNTTLLGLRLVDGHEDELQDWHAEVLSEALRQNSTLLVLEIESSGYEMSFEGARLLSDGLRHNLTLLSLTISGGWIGPDGARHLSDALRQNSTLMALDISECEIGDDGTRHLSDALRQNSTLLLINVSGLGFVVRNPIGPEGARYLSDALRHNSTLLSLCISHNNIGPLGARHLSDALRQNSTLLSLDISHNRIEDEGAQDLSDALQQNSTLLSLDIGGCQIGDDDGARHISPASRQGFFFGHSNTKNYGINNKQLEDQINSEIKSRRSDSISRLNVSFDVSATCLISLFGISSWTSVRGESVSAEHNQLPSEMWNEVVSFLSDDRWALEESFLVSDLRSGFLHPLPPSHRLLFSARSVPLLSMIPLIEGYFRFDRWTIARLEHLGLRDDYSEFLSGVISPSSSWMQGGVELSPARRQNMNRGGVESGQEFRRGRGRIPGFVDILSRS